MTPNTPQQDKDVGSWEEKALMAVIYKDLEIYEEEGEPTRWKVDSDKLKEFVNSLHTKWLTELKGEVEKKKKKVPKDCGEDCYCVHCEKYQDHNKVIHDILQLLNKKTKI